MIVRVAVPIISASVRRVPLPTNLKKESKILKPAILPSAVCL